MGGGRLIQTGLKPGLLLYILISQLNYTFFFCMHGLIWVQTVCKGYKQTTKVATGRERIKRLSWVPTTYVLY